MGVDWTPCLGLFTPMEASWMSCIQTIQDYGLRAIGIGERLLPREDFTLCQQFTLIGSGMIWNIYFGLTALVLGFLFATVLALGKASPRRVLRKPSEWFIFIFRGSPLFIQFFFAYFVFLSLKAQFPDRSICSPPRGLAHWWCFSSIPPPIQPRFSTARSKRFPRGMWRPRMPTG